MLANPLVVGIFAGLIVGTLGSIFVVLQVQKRRKEDRERGATELIGVGPDLRSRRILTKVKDKDNVQIRDGPLIQIRPEGISIDQESGLRRYVFNLATGLPLVAMHPLDELIHYLHAAVFHSNRSIERVHRSHGEIPWALIALFGVLGIVLIIAILAGVTGYVATHVKHG